MTTQGGKWITEKDWRVDAWRCLGVLRDARGHVGCRAPLTLPFYQPYDTDHGTALCTSCAYLHLKVSPPESPKRRGYKAASVEIRIGVDPAFSGDMAAIATVDTATGRVVDMKYPEPSTDCGHAPSDETCRCWGVRCGPYKDDQQTRWLTVNSQRGFNRRQADAHLSDWAREYKFRPYDVIRYTGSNFPETSAPVVTPADAATKATEYKCQLPWCGQLFTTPPHHSAMHHVCCSERCSAYETRREKVVATHDAFLRQLAKRDGGVLSLAIQTIGEQRWADAQRDREIAPIEAQFKSLRIDRAAVEPEGK